jgi:hypothetical protein
MVILYCSVAYCGLSSSIGLREVAVTSEEKQDHCVRSEVLTAVLLRFQFFWDAAMFCWGSNSPSFDRSQFCRL